MKDDVRDARGTRFLHDGTRLRRSRCGRSRAIPGFATVAILTLAVGIGGTTAVFSAVDAVLLQPLPYQQPGQLVRLYYTDVRRKEDRGVVTPVHFLDYRQSMSSFASIAALFMYSETGADIGTGDDVRRIRILASQRGLLRRRARAADDWARPSAATRRTARQSSSSATRCGKSSSAETRRPSASH